MKNNRNFSIGGGVYSVPPKLPVLVGMDVAVKTISFQDVSLVAMVA